MSDLCGRGQRRPANRIGQRNYCQFLAERRENRQALRQTAHPVLLLCARDDLMMVPLRVGVAENLQSPTIAPAQFLYSRSPILPKPGNQNRGAPAARQ